MIKNKKIILIDMDNTIVNTELGFDMVWKQIYHDNVPINWKKRGTLYIKDNFVNKFQSRANKILVGKGFYANLPPIKPAINAIKMLITNKYYIYFCTRPNEFAYSCIKEKQSWIKKYFGKFYSERIIFTYYKNLFNVDILIDDVIEKQANFKQILTTTYQNKKIKTTIPRIKRDWSNWMNIYNNHIKI